MLDFVGCISGKQLLHPCSCPSREATDSKTPWWNVISVRPLRSLSVTVTSVSGPGPPPASSQACVNTNRSGGTISRYTPRMR